MKIEVIDSNRISLFINSNYLYDVDLNSKEAIILYIKDIIIKYKEKIKLRGFYKVKVFVKDEIGLFIDMIRLDDNEYNNTVDLKIIVNNYTKVYFKTENYEVLPIGINVYYLDNYFYCDVNDISNIYSVVEFGEYIYGRNIDYVVNNAINMKF